MQIVEMDVSKLIPYVNNPRNNEDAVDYVASSISSFGFKVPIIVDKDGVIVAGHTRLLAAKKLHMKRVPCIIADDLTEDQVKAFRLADNKVSEKSTWDDVLLSLEMQDIQMDLSPFGFDVHLNFEEEDKQEEKENERERTMDAYNLHEFDAQRAVGFYQLPVINKVRYIPDRLIGFNYVKTTPPQDGMGVHFFIDDYQFERVWNSPNEYIDKLADYSCVLTPDFSLYLDMPMALKIYNVYRSRMIGQLLQDVGGVVIPTLQWAERETFSFCFEGIEQGGTVAVSTIGVKRSAEAMQVWKDGMTEALKVIKPKDILLYGGHVDFDYGNAHVVYMSNEVTERMKEGRK